MKIFSASLRLCGFSKAPLLTKEGWTPLRRTGWFSLSILLLAAAALAQVPAPKDILGFTPGDDRKLASWSSIVDYFKKLDAASDRVMFEEIGKTTMGAPFVYATISSPENLKNLEKYKMINAELADPRKLGKYRGLPADRAKAHIASGKTIVMITCGIHSTEVGSTLSSMLIAHRLATVSHPDIKKILDNTIILLVPSLNPDGVDIVKNWYDKTLGTPYEGTEPPELYHKYVGHDNNRDWYAFTQVETQLTVDKIHNVWHPQIVHDIHQQGANGARMFLPPYMQPVEPNVPKQIVEGYTELGNAMAKSMRDIGYQGITTNSTYDAWTPARAYSHYHGGVRILSETASARLATPIKVDFERLRVAADDGYDPKVESPNFGPVWKGGDWKLKNITDYMTTAANALMMHAADNREKWLSRFYEIGKEAVRPRKKGELFAFILPGKDASDGDERFRRGELEGVLLNGGVETSTASEDFVVEGRRFPAGSIVIPMSQPYGGFAKALAEIQKYPDLKDSDGHPITPYDVTAHTLPLLFGVEMVAVNIPFRHSTSNKGFGSGRGCGCGRGGSAGGPPPPDVLIYKSHIPSMDEGWTRWLAENAKPLMNMCCFASGSVSNESIRLDSFRPSSFIIFPDQSAAQILNGYPKGTMPDEYVGGVGKEGVENLKKFVEAGGTLVFLNRSSQFAIEQFNLPVKDVTRGLNRKDFYIPGSILRTELDLTHPIAKGMPKESIAWFENSPAFEIVRVTPSGVPSSGAGTAEAVTLTPRIIASYPKDPKNVLLSGWALGAEKIAGKAALVEFTIGKGKVVLFGFRPQYRGQSLATFPLLFNAISQ